MRGRSLWLARRLQLREERPAEQRLEADAGEQADGNERQPRRARDRRAGDVQGRKREPEPG